MAKLSSVVKSLLAEERATANNALDGTARKLAMCVKALDGSLSMFCSSIVLEESLLHMLCCVVYEMRLL